MTELKICIPAGPWHVTTIGNFGTNKIVEVDKSCSAICRVGMNTALAAFANTFGVGGGWKREPAIQPGKWIAEMYVPSVAQVVAHIPQMLAFIEAESQRGNSAADAIIESLNQFNERPNRSIPLTSEQVARSVQSVAHLRR